MPDDSLIDESSKHLHRRAAGALLNLGFHSRRETESLEDAPGDMICRYRLIAPLGEGGFGVVWTALQTEPIQREVALKLIKRGMDSREIVARFEAESQALARMDHPNIAAVLDAGTADDGRPLFAMELVKGPPINTFCDARKLCVRERLKLFIPVCQAVQHAHQKSILHRDLKPSNILVAEVDGRPLPKVIDFGIAKALGDANEAVLQASLLQTRAGTILGTLQYMSPEQAGSAPDVDTRSDIYSLGVILYELLTGRSPLEGLAGGRASYEEMLRRIREEEAPRPSTMVTDEHAVERGTDPVRLRRVLRGDLDWILLKALDKDRRRRYETATAFAQDLRRYLKEEPVSAAAPTWRYQAAKLVRRNRLAFSAASIAFAALLIASAVSLWQLSEARKASALAEGRRQEAVASAARAREAVEIYLNNITEHPDLAGDEFRDLRKELLNSALPFYEAMARNPGSDPGVRADRGLALSRLGWLHSESGDLDTAMSELGSATAILEQLASEHPEDPVFRMRLCGTINSVALTLSRMGKPEQAVRLLKRALTISEELAREFPENAEHRESRVLLLLNQSKAMAAVGDVRGAITSGKQAIQLLEAEAGTSPDDTHLASLASAYEKVGAALSEAGDLKQADKYYQDAAQAYEKLTAKPGANRNHVVGLGLTYQNHAVLLDKLGKPADALSRGTRAVGVCNQLVANFGGTAQYRDMLATSCVTEGQILMKLNRPREAEDRFKAALQTRRTLVAQFPRDPRHVHLEGFTLKLLGDVQAADAAVSERSKYAARENYVAAAKCQRKALELRAADWQSLRALREALLALAEIDLQLGDWRSAVETGEELATVRTNGWIEHEVAAGVVARAITQVEDDPALTPEERTQLVEKTTERALDLIRRSIDLGNGRAHGLLENPKFERLHDNPVFRDLAKEPAVPPGSSPARFTLDYPHDDPGRRTWKRDGETWTETMPSGKVNRFKVAQRRWVLNFVGTEITAEDRPISLFIPDKESPPPHQLLFRGSKGGNWVSLGKMEDVE